MGGRASGYIHPRTDAMNSTPPHTPAPTLSLDPPYALNEGICQHMRQPATYELTVLPSSSIRVLPALPVAQIGTGSDVERQRLTECDTLPHPALHPALDFRHTLCLTTYRAAHGPMERHMTKTPTLWVFQAHNTEDASNEDEVVVFASREAAEAHANKWVRETVGEENEDREPEWNELPEGLGFAQTFDLWEVVVWTTTAD